MLLFLCRAGRKRSAQFGISTFLPVTKRVSTISIIIRQHCIVQSVTMAGVRNNLISETMIGIRFCFPAETVKKIGEIAISFFSPVTEMILTMIIIIHPFL